ncbi:MAG TPA: M3 family oligoendopeptidase [bacterium]|nr:M3 family oligoendopeptidase [bacterium]
MKRTVIAAALAALFVFSAQAAAYEPDANAPRSSVPAEYKWDTGAILKSDGAWNSAAGEVEAKLKALSRRKGTLSDAASIRACLDEFVGARKLMDRVSMYANLKAAEDENDEGASRMHQRSLSLLRKFMDGTSFIKQEILSIDDARMAEMMKGEALAPYRAALSDMRRRKAHMLTPEAERVMSLAGDNLLAEIDLNELPSDVELVFKAVQRDIQLPKIADEGGKDVQLTFSNYGKYRQSKDRRVRKDAVEGFLAALKKYENIFAATFGGEMRRDVWLARARNYGRAVEGYLDVDNVPPKVVDDLVRAVNRNLKPLHRYVALRKKLLGLPDVRLYDLYTPIVPAAAKDVPYSEALSEIKEALAPLGADYVEALMAGAKPGGGWVDVYPNKGKESGAFSSSIWGVHPFVKLNYQDAMDDASTAAHEFGHAMHSYLNSRANSYVDSGYSTFTAEIASTFNERLLIRHLLGKPNLDDATRLYLLGELVEGIRTTIYRQTLFAEFELRAHELAEKGTPITAELLNKTYADLVKKYYGPGFRMGDNDALEWAYIPHFYWKFYVFSYATGLSSGIALADKVAGGDKATLEGYLAMLREPVSTPPLAALSKTGLELSEAVDAALSLMDRTVAEMERIAARR